MRRAVLLIAVSLFAIALFWGCAGPQPGVVAKVGKYTITAEELNKMMANARFKSYDEELDARKRRVERLAEDKLILLAAYDEGLDKKEELTKQLNRDKENLLLNALYKTQIEEKAGEASEEQVKAAYERKKELLHAKHILVESKELADSIYDMLKNGANFDELAKKYSMDKSNKDRGGDLGDFTTMQMVKEFEDAAYALSPGEFSKPVKTRYGWHIIYLVERKPNPRVKSFEEEKDAIKRTLDNRLKTDMANKFVEDLVNSANIQIKDDAADVILNAYANADEEPPKPNQRMPQKEIKLTPEQRAMTLCTYSLGTFTVGQFDSMYQAAPPFRRPKFNSREDIKKFLENALKKELLLEKAIQLNIENTDEYKKLYRENLERKMIDAYRKEYLYKDVKPTDEEIKAYYDANPDSFMQDEQVKVIEIQVATEDEANKLIERIKKGEDISKLATKYTLRSYAKAKGGDLGFFGERRYPELFKAAKTLKPGELYPKPIPFQGKFSIIKLVEKKEPHIKEFNTVKRIIKNKLRSKMRKEAYERWLEQAKQKYGYKIYESEIEKTIDKSKYEQKAEE